MQTNWFWQKVHPTDRRQIEIEAHDLDAAIRIAVENDERQFDFIYHEGLIDLFDRFRIFRFRERLYVLKISSDPLLANIERANGKEFARRCKDIDWIRIVPTALHSVDSRIIQCMPYAGKSMHDRSSVDLARVFYRTLEELLSRGILWEGFAPRNILINEEEDCLCFIDFEDVLFLSNCRTIPRHVVFKWALNWNSLFGEHCNLRELSQHLSSRGYIVQEHLEFDSFEKTYSFFFDLPEFETTILSGVAVTLQSERDLSPEHHSNLCSPKLPFDLGHLVDEIFHSDQLISVFYSMTASMIRSKYGESHFACFLTLTAEEFARSLRTNLNKTSTHAEVKGSMLLAILVGIEAVLNGQDLDPERICQNTGKSVVQTSVHSFRAILEQAGYEHAYSRARHVESFMEELLAFLTSLEIISAEFELLARGSFAHRLLTLRSDVDFELSNTDWPVGSASGELLIKTIGETILGLHFECSNSRPLEDDMHGKNGTRDLHEWMELRRIHKEKITSVWPAEDVPLPDGAFWWIASQYERSNPALTPKFLFFRIRAFILRIAKDHGIESPIVTVILDKLNEMDKSSIANQVAHLLSEAIDLYEAPKVDPAQVVRANNNLENLILRYRSNRHSSIS